MFKLFNKIKFNRVKKERTGRPNQCPASLFENELLIYFENKVIMRITRRSSTPLQNELSAFVPKAEIRKKRYEKGQITAEEELVLNSITLVDAPLRLP